MNAVYWVMDFNPDEAIAAGWLTPGWLVARMLDWMSRFSLKRASKIIAGENQRGESERHEAVTAQFSQCVLLAGMVAELERSPNR